VYLVPVLYSCFLYFVISVCMFVRGARLQAMPFVQPMQQKIDN